jgi:chemotaxis methyl-accepting protein methylase
VPVNCEPVEKSPFFDRQFDAVLAWGMVFLLSVRSQRELIGRISVALRPGGRLLFTSPEQVVSCTDDSLYTYVKWGDTYADVRHDR